MAQHEAIIALHRAGKKNSELFKLIKAPKSIVYDTSKRFKELGNASDRPQSWRPQTVRTQKLKHAVKAHVKRNQKRSKRKMAREMDVSEPTGRRTVKTEMKSSSLEMQISQHLNKLKDGWDMAEVIFLRDIVHSQGDL